MKTVTYQSLGRSGRVWTVVFKLSSEEANGLALLKYAWSHNAKIISCV